MKHKSIIASELETLRKNNLYRKLLPLSISGPTAKIGRREVVLLCSNDYLGLSRDSKVASVMSMNVKKGISQCGSRLVCGSSPELHDLEKRLARQKRRESALTYPAGYMANIGVVTALADNQSLIVSDELNHASIVDACRMSRAQVRVFRHNDPDDLQVKLRGDNFRSKLVITEGVYSMDGDLAKLTEIGKIAHDSAAMFVLDDAHGDFVLGSNFRGTAEHLDAEKYVDMIISSMSKALGCFGGYVTADDDLIEYLVNRSRAFIYTSALPSVYATAADEALKIALTGKLQKQLSAVVDKFQRGLKELGFNVVGAFNHIIPLMIGDEKNAVRFSETLLKNGVYAQAIRYPTVPKGRARLRVSLTSLLDNYVDEALDAIRKTKKIMMNMK